MMKTREELLKVELEKWPQCIITGKKISEESALEIIRRTDSFFEYFYCSDEKYQNKLIEILKIPTIWPGADTDMIHQTFELQEVWKSRWGYISTEYIHNDFIDSSFVGGTNGWCHPDGTIEYHYNIGKWPTVKEVLIDLENIQREFPFLELECTLMNHEWCEDSTPVVSFATSSGSSYVEIIDPMYRNIHEERGRTIKSTNQIERDLESGLEKVLTYGSDRSIPFSVIEDWAKYLE